MAKITEIGKVNGRIVIDFTKNYTDHELGMYDNVKVYFENEADISEVTLLGLIELAKIQVCAGGYEFVDKEGNIIAEAPMEEDE